MNLLAIMKGGIGISECKYIVKKRKQEKEWNISTTSIAMIFYIKLEPSLTLY